MSEKKDLNNLPKYLKPEIAERVAEHFRDGAESVLDKLRRIMAGNLEGTE